MAAECGDLEVTPGVVLDGTHVEENGTFSEGGAAEILVSYWFQRCAIAPETGPQWADFELMDIYKIANRVVVKDVLNGGEEFRNRYWGTNITEAFQIDATGKIIRQYLSLEHTRQALDVLRLVIRDVRPVRVWGRAAFFEQTQHKPFEAAFVPLFDGDGSATQVISAFNFDFLDPGE